MGDTTVDQMLALLGQVDSRSIAYEIKRLRAIKKWAQERPCKFVAGDKVEMNGTLDLSSLGGWAPYAEAMAPGATATVQAVDFNEHSGYWYAEIVFDREWSVSSFDGTTRFWNGPASETPDGFTPPSAYYQEHYPEGRKHTFAMPVRHLRLAAPVPGGAEQ